MEYHRLLDKQIKKTLPAQYLQDDVILQFLNSINNSFNNFDKSIKLADHAFNISANMSAPIVTKHTCISSI